MGCMDSIKRNVEACGFSSITRILKMDAEAAIALMSKEGQKFDLIFVDPPYLKNLVNPTLQNLSNSSIIHKETLIIVEHHPKEPINPTQGLLLTDTRKYGQTLISFVRTAL